MPPPENIDDIRWAVEELGKRQRETRLYSLYYSGEHARMIDETRLRTIFGRLFRDFRLNLCSSVVDALTDRLQIASFSSGGGAEEDQAAQDAQDIWKRNRMHRQAGEVHQSAIATGDSYVLVWPDANGRAVLYPQASHEVCVKYDPGVPGRIVKAAKLWKTEEGNHRLNLYYPERIEKYDTEKKSAGASLNPNGFREFREEREAWPLVNQYAEVPIFHFANNAPLGKYGVSELRDAVPVQDWMNYAVFSLLVGQEFQSFPQRYAVGVEVPRDENNRPVSPFKNGPEKVWALEGGESGVQIGQLPGANLDQLVRVKQEISLSMAQVTGTPAHYFFLPGGLVSGESQKTAEQKLDSKVSDRSGAFGDAWAAAMALAVRMERGSAVDGLELDANWRDLKPRNEVEEWNVAGMKADLGVSREQILREQGYTDEQIDKFREEAGSLGQEPAVSVPSLGSLSLNGGG